MRLPDQAKQLFKIALPTIGENYLQNLLGIIDSFFIAKMGLLAINAVGVTNIYNMTYTGVFTAISTALSVFLSRAFGARDIKRSHGALFHGLFVALIMGLCLGCLSLFFHHSFCIWLAQPESLSLPLYLILKLF